MDITRERLLQAFDQLGWAAIHAHTRLDLLVYGGSALMIASNFRWATGDVDIAPIGEDSPEWFSTAVNKIAAEMGFEEGENWLNDAVSFHLSRTATKDNDHVIFGTFPRGSEQSGLAVFVPTPEYMLALKLKAFRVNDPKKAEQEVSDIQNLLQVNGIRTVEAALECLGKYFPTSAKSADAQRFLLPRMLNLDWSEDHESVYPTPGF